MPDKLRVLVLCTGNSCRSIMGEALINQLAGDRYTALSAGSRPTGYVHPKAIATLIRHGIDPGSPQSKSWLEFGSQAIDLVITVCDQAVNENCPIFHGTVQKRHWGIPDPAYAAGVRSEEQETADFDKTFLLLKRHIEQELV